MYASVEEFIHFIGFSYGSFLGAVYANAFPDRVDQFMVDSILDLSDYSGEIFKVISSSLTHTEDAMNALGSACDAAGPETCVLAGMPINGSSDDSTVTYTIRQFIRALSINHF
jgi:pimeloyl-ACP methyl ester carboxylesterase